MWYIFFILLSFYLNVGAEQSFDTNNIIANTPGVYYIEELDEYEVAEYKLQLFNNGSLTNLTTLEQLCCSVHNKCIHFMKSNGKVCAHHRNYGLIDFANACEVRFYNCLIKAYAEKYEYENSYELFFYNGKGYTCQHYIDKSSTIENAVKIYYMDDINFRLQHFKYVMKNKN